MNGIPLQCQPIQDEINDLTAEIHDLRAQLPGANGPEKTGIFDQIRQDEQTLRRLRSQLQTCLARSTSNVGIDFLGAPVWFDRGPNPITTGNTSITGAVQTVTALRTVHADQSHTYVLYAATVNGGVWRCDNFVDAMLTAAGQPLPPLRWIPLTDQVPTMSICSVALDPLDATGNTVWAATGGLSSGQLNRPALGLLKTTNGRGQNPAWDVMGAALAPQRIISVVPTSSMDPATGKQVILVAALDGQGILRSNDGGQTFQTVNGPAGPLAGLATDLIADPNDPQTFYAAISANFQNQELIQGGIFRSTDGGINWEQITLGIPQVGRSVSLKLAIFNNAAGAVPGLGQTVLYAAQANTTGNDNNLIGLFRCGNPTASPLQWATIFISPNAAVVPNGNVGWPAGAKVPMFAMAVDPTDWNNMYLGWPELALPCAHHSRSRWGTHHAMDAVGCGRRMGSPIPYLYRQQRSDQQRRSGHFRARQQWEHVDLAERFSGCYRILRSGVRRNPRRGVWRRAGCRQCC